MCSNFDTSADAPAERASFSVEEPLYALNMITGTSGIICFRTRVASSPFITGHRPVFCGAASGLPELSEAANVSRHLDRG
jgi:hypothetical protein